MMKYVLYVSIKLKSLSNQMLVATFFAKDVFKSIFNHLTIVQLVKKNLQKY